MTGADATGADGEVLRVLRGHPTPDEIAALLAVLAALPTAAPERASRPTSAWADRRHGVRPPLPHGAGAWHASSWPG